MVYVLFLILIMSVYRNYVYVRLLNNYNAIYYFLFCFPIIYQIYIYIMMIEVRLETSYKYWVKLG